MNMIECLIPTYPSGSPMSKNHISSADIVAVTYFFELQGYQPYAIKLTNICN